MATELIYTIRDADGDKATTSFHLEDEIPLADLQGVADYGIGVIENLIYGEIDAVHAYVRPSASGLTGNTALAESDAERQGKFEFITGMGSRVKLNVPTLAESVGQGAGSDDLDQSDTQVAALIAAMEDGIDIGGTVIQPCDIGEESLVGTIFAREAHKNSGKRS